MVHHDDFRSYKKVQGLGFRVRKGFGTPSPYKKYPFSSYSVLNLGSFVPPWPTFGGFPKTRVQGLRDLRFREYIYTCGRFLKLGVPSFADPQNKDSCILVSMWAYGIHKFGKSQLYRIQISPWQSQYL